jgi:hypothetical protein
MAILFCDGFDHYGTGTTSATNMALGMYSVNGTVQCQTAIKRAGTHALELSGGYESITRSLGADLSVIGVALAVYYLSYPGYNNELLVTTLRDLSGAIQCTVVIGADGRLHLYRGDVTTLLASSAVTVPLNAFAHIESKFVLSNTAGSVSVRLNGAEVIAYSGDTCGSSSYTTASSVRVGTYFRLMYVDDLIIHDGADFVGDMNVLLLPPSADTAEADFVTVGAASGFDCIDEVEHDADTTYIKSSVSGDISEFALQDLPAGYGNIQAVAINKLARKTESGAGSLKMSIRQGVSVAAGESTALTTGYSYSQDIFETDPASGVAFTATNANDLILRTERTE